VLEQLRSLKKPKYLTFECNCLLWLNVAYELGYREFKLVEQAEFQSKNIAWDHRLWDCGPPCEEAIGVSGDGGWVSRDEVEASIRKNFRIHSEGPVKKFVASGQQPFVQHDFAVLKSVFPIESVDEEQWYDIHARLG